MLEVSPKLPTVIILSVLVLLFFFLRKQHPTVRFRMWYLAWVLILWDFALELLSTPLRIDPHLTTAIHLVSLVLSGSLFLTSVAVVSKHRTLRLTLILTMGTPLLLYGIALAYGVHNPAVYILLLALAIAGGVYHRMVAERPGPYALFSSLSALVLGLASMRPIWLGVTEFGFYAAVSFIFALTAIIFYRAYRRLTPGVLTTAGGFLAWSATASLPLWNAGAALASGITDLPKFIVAIGMVVTLMEDERIAAEAARLKQRRLYDQMRRFARLTEQLLAGKDVGSLAGPIANVLVDSGLCQRAAVLRADEQQQLILSGSAGFSAHDAAELAAWMHGHTDDWLEAACAAGEPLSLHSFRCVHESRSWVLVPFRSRHQPGLLGAFLLEDTGSNTGEDFSALEAFAAEVTVASENQRLQQQLFRAEKLASMGKLVGGVAHELNNPLTVVLGYTELIAEQHPQFAAELEAMRRESLRMKRIIENLQRFSREQKISTAAVNLATVVQEAINLRAYDLKTSAIDVEVNLDPALPLVAADESLLNQVMLNVLSNSIDAVGKAKERRVNIEGSASNGRVQIRVSDTGPGFSDLHRVFDPFFTTKSPGKGTGLGLSMCYGIIRDHGGEITASNLEPHGACITILLPAAR